MKRIWYINETRPTKYMLVKQNLSTNHYNNSFKNKYLSTNHITICLKINIYLQSTHTLYIYCHPLTDCFVVSQLFSVARQARFLNLGSKPGWLKCQSKILPLSHEETCASEGNLNAYVSHLFCLHVCIMCVCVCVCVCVYFFVVV